MNNVLYYNLYLHLKSTSTLKKSSTFANLLMEKSSSWFAMAKMWEKLLKKKEVLRRGPASLLKI